MAIALLVAATSTLFCGAMALRRADDARAVYWLCLGAISLVGAVHVARFGTGS
ncbi:MAG: hypothetical protein FWD17_07300 [Polyangiaceae bacterium]|nr:hypothetical protein [Polyangiaceae bacterium]